MPTNNLVGSLNYMVERYNYTRIDIKIRKLFKLQQNSRHQIIKINLGDIRINNKKSYIGYYPAMADMIKYLRKQGVSAIIFSDVFTAPNICAVNCLKKELDMLKINSNNTFSGMNIIEKWLYDNEDFINEIKGKKDIVLRFYLVNHKIAAGLLPKPSFTINDTVFPQIPIINTNGYVSNFSNIQKQAMYTGFSSDRSKSPGIVNKYPLVLRLNNQVYFSLAVEALKALYPGEKIKINTRDFLGKNFIESIQIGNKIIKTDGNGQVWVPSNYTAPNLKEIDFTDVATHRVKTPLKDSIVVVGFNRQEYESNIMSMENRGLSNIDLQILILNTILNSKLPYTPYWGNIIIIFMIISNMVIIIALSLYNRMIYAAIFLLIIQSIYTLLNLFIFSEYGVVILTAGPALMSATMIIIFILSAYQFESRKKNYLRDAFSQYVPPEYLKLLLNNPDSYGLDGRTLELTVLFADIRDFTRLSEHLDAAGVKTILNTFLTPMTKIILRNKGTIDKYFGDMVMAFWGAPIENSRHNEWALNAAIEMIEKTISLKPIFRLHKLPEIDIGIGLNSGLMNVGDMGSEFRRSYTVIGDAVNLGARLQSATKYYGVKIIAGRETVIHQTKFIYRLIDKCLVKGKTEIIEVFEVICRTSALTPELAIELKEHSNALNVYFTKDFDLALELFQALSDTYPDSCLYKVFLNRILDFKKNKPEPDWNGAFELKYK